MHRPATALAVTLAAIAFTVAPRAAAESAPDVGRPFEPHPISRPIYDVRPPTDDNGQRHFIEASDGTRIFVETWLPVAKPGGPTPPNRLPTVLDMTPYVAKGEYEYVSTLPDFYFVRRGYAFAQAHLRGTGESGGCFTLGAPIEADDNSRVVEYLGRDAPWTNGRVGAFGLSGSGGAAVAVAAEGDRRRTRYLKAIVPIAPNVSEYDLLHADGVEFFLLPDLHKTNAPENSAATTRDPAVVPERAGCYPEYVTSTEKEGNVNAYYRARDYRDSAARIVAATLMAHGHADTRVSPLQQVGLFERIPETTPKAGLFGIFAHEAPQTHADSGLPEEWERADYLPMVVAWYDRYLKGLPTGVEDWPVAQVQGNDGQWRAEPNWPFTGGPVGHLALGPEGTLGVRAPSGESMYREVGFETTQGRLPGSSLVWETAPLPERLEITAQPVLDLWVRLDRPDAHLAARIETLGPDGEPLGHQTENQDGGDLINTGVTSGYRSMQHLEPLVQNRFWQDEGVPAPVGEPVRVRVRFQPTDLVIPKGGSVRIVLAGSLIARAGLRRAGIPEPLFEDPSLPSGSFTTVTVLHDCEHPSALRFLMPRPRPRLLNVREPDETGPLRAVRGRITVSDAGGLVTAPVCGRAPVRLPMFGPPIQQVAGR
jgi:X-Pro dipeptidyl-peptidase